MIEVSQKTGAQPGNQHADDNDLKPAGNLEVSKKSSDAEYGQYHQQCHDRQERAHSNIRQVPDRKRCGTEKNGQSKPGGGHLPSINGYQWKTGEENRTDYSTPKSVGVHRDVPGKGQKTPKAPGTDCLEE